MKRSALLERLRRSAWITAAVFFVFLLAFLVWSVTSTDVLPQLTRYFAILGAPSIVIVVALSLLNFALRTLRWHWYAGQLGIASSIGNTVNHYVSGFSMGVTPGRVGEVVRLWMLHTDCRTSYHRGLALLVADRVNDLLAIILLAIGASIVATGALSTGVLAAAAFGTVLFFLLRHPQWIVASVDCAYGVVRRFDRFFAGLRRSLRVGRELFSVRNSIVAAPLSLVAWFAECVGFFVILASLDTAITLPTATFIYAFATLVGAMTFLPGGVGGFEATAVLLLGTSGVDTVPAIVAVTIIRIATLWFSVALGWLFFARYLAVLSSEK